jgi:hypothetical protein
MSDAVRFVGDLERLELKDGDRFVLTCSQAISDDLAKRLRSAWTAFVGGDDRGMQLLILHSGMRLGIVNTGDLGAEIAEAPPGPREPKILAALSGMAAWDDLLAERLRQVEAEGWSHEHDDKHDRGEMALAAASYAAHAVVSLRLTSEGSRLWDAVTLVWPWAWTWWKPKDPRRDLIRAGALILAEIERIDRATVREAARG